MDAREPINAYMGLVGRWGMMGDNRGGVRLLKQGRLTRTKPWKSTIISHDFD